jgi:hypothetical protein
MLSNKYVMQALITIGVLWGVSFLPGQFKAVVKGSNNQYIV